MIKYHGNYRGIVKAHGSHGRCKIYIPGVYRVEDADNIVALPDAEPAQSLFAGCNNGQGCFQYPLIGSIVWCFFENGDHLRPIFFASSLGGSTASSNFIKDKYIIETSTSKIIIDDTSGSLLINIDSNGNINIPQITINATSNVIINSPSVKINQGTVTVTGGDVIADGISLKLHKHNYFPGPGTLTPSTPSVA